MLVKLQSAPRKRQVDGGLVFIVPDICLRRVSLLITPAMVSLSRSA
jgi:hypothetical protein